MKDRLIQLPRIILQPKSRFKYTDKELSKYSPKPRKKYTDTSLLPYKTDRRASCNRMYYQKNKDRISRLIAKNYLENSLRRKKTQKKWREEHREYCTKYAKKYYKDNKERILLLAKKRHYDMKKYIEKYMVKK